MTAIPYDRTAQIGRAMITKRKSRVLAIDDEPSMIEWLKILL